MNRIYEYHKSDTYCVTKWSHGAQRWTPYYRSDPLTFHLTPPAAQFPLVPHFSSG